MSDQVLAQLQAALGASYTIVRELGAGGMATVYLARDRKHDRDVAVKVLKPELAAVLGAERFVVEIRTTAALQHPHILPLFDSGEAGGFLYYVMPFIEGETLRAKLDRETQFGVEEAVRITREVADALDYAHRHGVIHRDIKPENILLHDGRPMVADFGIALAVSAAAGGRMTETGLSLGTPHYMSPEQATAEKEITARADIYSLGSMLYEMLTGNPPHTGASAQQIIMKIIVEPAEPVTKFRRSVPPNVAAAVARSLEKVPADRFESAKAFSEALANPAFSTMSATGALAGSSLRRGDRIPAGVWAIGAVAAVALVAAVMGWRRPAPPSVVTRFSIALPDSQVLAPAFLNGNRIAISPDGRLIAYVGSGSAPGLTRLWLRALDQLHATPLAGTDGAINPSFSPDGRHVAFVAGSPRALKRVPVNGGPAITLTDSVVDLGGVSWADDGYIYIDAHLAGDGLARVRESGGAPEVASMPDSAAGESWHASPSALPHGRGVLMSIAHRRGMSDFDVGVLDLKTGRHKVLVRGAFAHYAASGHLIWVTPNGVMMSAPFDVDRLTLTGKGVPVADGVALRGLSRGDVALSASGTLLYAAGTNGSSARELVWISRDGAVTPVDSQWSATFAGRMSISPDGKSVALFVRGPTGSEQVWVKRLHAGGAAWKLSDAGLYPTWSPDGRSVLFATRSGELMVGPADGSVLPAVLRAGRFFTTPEYSPDGKWIVYSQAVDLFAIRTDGDTSTRTLVASPAADVRPTISPDGRWLAYASDASGRFEIYVRPFPNAQTANHQVTTSGGVAARWSRDGREMFFMNENFDIFTVPVTLEPTFSFGVPRRLFGAAYFTSPGALFEVSPDGQRFLMSRPLGGGAERPDDLIIVQNVFEELRAKARP